LKKPEKGRKNDTEVRKSDTGTPPFFDVGVAGQALATEAVWWRLRNHRVQRRSVDLDRHDPNPTPPARLIPYRS
jgi:hypothetical protein